MLIIIHSETNKTTIRQNLGRPEQLLLRPRNSVRCWKRSARWSKSAIPTNWWTASTATAASAANPASSSFSPPHRTPIHHACPTIPVFAWEFSTLPSETRHGEPRHDWRHVLRQRTGHHPLQLHGRRGARRHGSRLPGTERAGAVWDRFANRASQQAGRPEARDVRLRLDGLLMDSRQLDLAVHADPKPSAESWPCRTARRQVELSLDGVIYTSVFNPYDGRKNWQDMISAFCATFRDEPDATLVLKLTHHNVGEALADMLHHLYKNQSYRCRIVLIHGYLADPDYERLVGPPATW